MIFDTIFIWSEAWAPLIPLGVLLFHPIQPNYAKPVIIYLILSFVLNTFSDIIWQQKTLGVTLSVTNNNPLYNLNSVLRYVLLALFFVKLKIPFPTMFRIILPLLFTLFVIVDLLLWENFMAERIAHKIHAAEAGLLLVSCLLFFYHLMRNDVDNVTGMPAFWMATGLLIFVAVSFPIYVYYKNIVENYTRFAVNIWSVQKVAFLIFCILVAIGFYVPQKSKIAIYG